VNVLQTKIDSIKNASDLNFVSLSEASAYRKISEEELTNKGWLTNEDVYSVINRLSNLVSSLPITLMNGDNPVESTDPFYDKFYNNWNPKRGLKPELRLYVINYLLYGRAYQYKNSETLSLEPDGIWTLNTRNVTPSNAKYSYFNTPEYYYLFEGAKKTKIFSDELIIISNPTTEEDFYTEYVSPLQAVWNTVLSENNRSTAEKSMLANRGIAGFISPKAASGDASILGFAEPVMKKIRSAFSTLTGGASKFNKVEVLEKASEFTQLGMTANDLKVVEMRLNHVRSVCNALGVPSLLFNDYQSRTHANYKEAMKSMYTDAVIPLYDEWESQYYKQFLKDYNSVTGQDYWLKLQKDEIEALNRNVVDVFTSLNPAIAQRFMEKMSDQEVRDLMLEIGVIK
jgi:HK97 family phage portal protein